MRNWYGAWVMAPLPTAEQFLAWVSRAGFAEVHMEDITASGVRSGRRLYWMSLAALPAAVAMHRLGLRTEVQHTNVTGSIAAWRGYKRGLWSAGQTSATVAASTSRLAQPACSRRPAKRRTTTVTPDSRRPGCSSTQ